MPTVPSQRSSVRPGYPPLTQDGIKIIIISCVFTTLSALFVALRLWARKLTRQRLEFHDWSIVAALFFNCSFASVISYCAVTCGIGYHTEYLNKDWPGVVPHLNKTLVVAEALAIPSNSLVKISILHLYVRIFPDRHFQILCYVVMGLVTAGALGLFIRLLLQCTPLEAVWNAAILATDPTAHCVNRKGKSLSDPIINTSFDITLFLLPLPQMWRLQLELKKKLMVIGIFAVGFLICVITCVRVWAVLKLSGEELPYTIMEDLVWVILEPGLGIINACLPLLRALGPKFSSVLRCGVFSDKTRSSKQNSGSDFNRPRSKGGDHICVPSHEVSISTTEPRTRQEITVNDENEGDIPLRAYHEGQTGSCSQERESNRITVTVEWNVQRETSGGTATVV
ncbi:uncharacterized protein F4812DRAFT_451617 [Daldinia caldariorum]|uniref:uncharacterized protein n=1 Tax=Daldinia caldariorum TaxID=326644 RepID=UPI002008758C|nr:uncharacterized protein F4812DRAFT_451617 [Daldinia caldariorum]KAI1466650.1 hypothetical protein F4812DRAFT_451617 [Daldinia caldariorum]